MNKLVTKIIDRFTLWFIREFYKSQERQMSVWFDFVGDKGKEQIHLSSYLKYNSFTDKFVVDWDNKTITKIKR